MRCTDVALKFQPIRDALAKYSPKGLTPKVANQSSIQTPYYQTFSIHVFYTFQEVEDGQNLILY